MARAIDANELEMFPYSEGAGTEEQIADWIEQVGLSEDDTASRARDLCWKVIEGFINVVKTQPTLTSPNEWASVEDTVPDPGERVLATDGIFVGEAYRSSANSWFRHTGFPWRDGVTGRTVRFWMPLPAPPNCRPPEGEANA